MHLLPMEVLPLLLILWQPAGTVSHQLQAATLATRACHLNKAMVLLAGTADHHRRASLRQTIRLSRTTAALLQG